MLNSYCYSCIIIIIIISLCPTYASLPEYVHAHTMEEIAETNYVLLDKVDLCQSSGNSNVSLLIAIKTSPANREQRSVIRRTWLIEVMEHRIPYIFVIGNTKDQQLTEELLIEDKTYNDLLIGKPVDDYYNLTLKIVFLFAWTRHYCPHHWLLYIDDDTIVNTQKAIDFLASKKNERDPVIYGTLMDQTVMREPNSPWFVPRSIWTPDTYPPFCSGNGYLIPANTLPLLHKTATSRWMVPKLWIDDAFITGIVADLAGVKLISSPLLCCVYGKIELFQKNVLLGQMGKKNELLAIWKSIRENWTDNVQAHSSILRSKPKISRFSKQGYSLTVSIQNSDKSYDLTILKDAANFIHHPLTVGVMFLTIIAFLCCKKRVIRGNPFRHIRTCQLRKRRNDLANVDV